MGQDKMPEMGDTVNVGLAPVKLGNRYRIEFETPSKSHTTCYIAASNIADAITGLTATEIASITKLTIEKEN